MGQSYTVPVTGYYLLETWGAQGGYALTNSKDNRTPDNKPITKAIGGLGGYTSGKIKLKEGQVLYVFVGDQGQNYEGKSTTQINGGFNGGGSSMGCNTNGGGSGGGGATHISTKNSPLQSCTLPDVLIVSGGGGGAWACYYGTWNDKRGLSEGGLGGGLEGGRAGYGGTMGYSATASRSNIYNQGTSDSAAYNFATGGTQLSGGVQSCAGGSNSCFYTSSPATFGKGADSGNAAQHSGGGGGSGLYGGGAGASGENACGTGGGGGSSYTSASMLEPIMQQGVREGNGKVVISMTTVKVQACQTFVNCQIYLAMRLNNLLLVITSMS